MKHLLLTGVALAAMGFSAPAMAGGDIILTGHDNDYHCDFSGAGNPCGAIGSELNFVRDGSTLPVLVIDAGSEAVNSVAMEVGAGNTVGIAPSAVTAGTFNHAKYSAFVVASVTTCGGCDNPTGTGTQLAAFSTSIASFFNAGGGILGLTGAEDPNAFAYVPDAAGSPSPLASTSGFTATTAGTTNIPGFFAVNGDETHNTFAEPGTAGVSSAYQVAERYTADGGTGQAVTLFIKDGTIACTGTSCTITGGGGGGTPVPEPMSLALLGTGLFGLGAARRLRRG